jgi:hypothetical protein
VQFLQLHEFVEQLDLVHVLVVVGGVYLLRLHTLYTVKKYVINLTSFMT